MSNNRILTRLEQSLLEPEADLSNLAPSEMVERIREKVSAIDEPIIEESALLGLFEKLSNDGQPVSVKYGIDPTGPDIHLGHAIPLINARRLLRMGAKVDFVVGSFTARIGDPSLRDDSRPPLTEADVQRNVSAYRAQASRVVPVDHPNVRWHDNNEWLSKLPLAEWMEVLAALPAGEVMRRKDFRERIEGGFPLTMAEASYSALQAYDSFALKTDIEVGGWDQLLNMIAGRRLMEKKGLAPQTVMTFNLLPGTTGEVDRQGRLVKMSKSKGNYIGLGASEEEIYARVMSIPDSVMLSWFRELTDIRRSELEELKEALTTRAVHPMDTKRLLARTVTATLGIGTGVEGARRAENAFNRSTGARGRRNVGAAVAVGISEGKSLLDVLERNSTYSRSGIRGLVTQKGIALFVDGKERPATDGDLHADATDFNGMVVRVGRRNFLHLVTGPVTAVGDGAGRLDAGTVGRDLV